MIFEVKGKEDTVKMDKASLLDLLMGKVLEGTKTEFAGLVTALSTFLQERGTMSAFSVDQLLVTSFSLGYYYRVFLERNEVNIIGEENEPLDSQSTSERPGENDSSGSCDVSSGDSRNGDSSGDTTRT